MQRSVRIDMEIRVTLPAEPGKLAAVMKILKEKGGALRAHLLYRIHDSRAAFFVCDDPTECALALGEAGFEVETEQVVLVETQRDPHGLAHLVETLEAEGVEVGYSFASSPSEGLLVVLRTDNNPKAEDVLRTYLIPADPRAPEDLSGPDEGS